MVAYASAAWSVGSAIRNDSLGMTEFNAEERYGKRYISVPMRDLVAKKRSNWTNYHEKNYPMKKY